MKQETLEEVVKDREEMRVAMINTITSLQKLMSSMHEKHVKLLMACLRHLKPQRYQYAWELDELKKQREQLIEALEKYIEDAQNPQDETAISH